jgi:hypothetical protein
MPRIKNHSVPIGEMAAGLAGKTLSDATRSSSGGANYVVARTMVFPLAAGISSELALSVQNPESYPLVIRSATLVLRTPGQSSASLNIGIVGSSAATALDVVSSADISSAAVVPLIIGHALNNAGSSAITRANISVWEKNGASSDAWLTAKIKVDGASSLSGQLLIEAIPFYST